MNSVLDVAIQDCLTIGPSDNWAWKEKIAIKYGECVLDEIILIENFLGTIEPNWKTESFESFYQRAFNRVREQYPVLENESVYVLTNRIAYDNK